MQIAAVTASRSLQLWDYRMRHSHSTGWEARIQIGWLWAPASFKFLMLSQYFVLTSKILLLNASLYAWRKVRPNHTWTSEFAAKKGLLQDHARGWVTQLSSVQSLSRIQLFATPWTAAGQASLSITFSMSLLKLMFIESVMPPSHLILCCPLLLLPPIPPSIRVFSNESALRIRWPERWSFSFNISPSNEDSGLISFRMDWLNLLAA